MAPPSPPSASGLHKHACTVCARRKVKCDRTKPCSNCVKGRVECSFETPAPPRPRKRAADEELLSRLAQYEELMRQNGVDFTNHANIWVPSGLEDKPKSSFLPQSPVSIVSPASRPLQETYPSEDTSTDLQLCLWCNLNPELKYPSLQNLRDKEDPSLHPLPPLPFTFSNTEPDIHELHPEPKHIYRLWQIFVDAVNPLFKVVHVPTLQQRILDICWDPKNASLSLTALMFSIYSLAVNSIPRAECLATFGEERQTLFMRYRVATLRTLITANFLTTNDFEVLQALFLFLLGDPESELSSSLGGAAARLAQKMGLCRENRKASFFDKEMGLRLWWQIGGLDARALVVHSPGGPIQFPKELGKVRLPMNVNDADLHPDMAEAPAEQDGPTEMACVLMKLAVPHWLGSARTDAAKTFSSIVRGPVRGHMSTTLDDAVVDELENMCQSRLRNIDRSIPLHNITYVYMKLASSRMRFKVHHPRGRAAVKGGDVYMTREKSDVLFEAALTMLEMVDQGMRSKFSSHMFTRLATELLVDVVVYVVSDLRRRVSGERVTLAWSLMEGVYARHPDLIDDGESSLFVALGDLVLEAWEARSKELARGEGGQESDATPKFVQRLWDRRQKMNEESSQAPPVPETQGMGIEGLGLTDDDRFDWEYWNDFLQL